MDIQRVIKMDIKPDGKYICFYCGDNTHQSPVIFDTKVISAEFNVYSESEFLLVYPSCCVNCACIGLWNSILSKNCDPDILKLAYNADEKSIVCARIQEAFDRLCRFIRGSFGDLEDLLVIK